jgi:hypothetical protein
MAGELDFLPARQSGVDRELQLVHALFDPGDLESDVGIVGVPAHLLHLLFQLYDGLLELQYRFGHRVPPVRGGTVSGY